MWVRSSVRSSGVVWVVFPVAGDGFKRQDLRIFQEAPFTARVGSKLGQALAHRGTALAVGAEDGEAGVIDLG